MSTSIDYKAKRLFKCCSVFLFTCFNLLKVKAAKKDLSAVTFIKWRLFYSTNCVLSQRRCESTYDKTVTSAMLHFKVSLIFLLDLCLIHSFNKLLVANLMQKSFIQRVEVCKCRCYKCSEYHKWSAIYFFFTVEQKGKYARWIKAPTAKRKCSFF